jgi:hypothetical protein
MPEQNSNLDEFLLTAAGLRAMGLDMSDGHGIRLGAEGWRPRADVRCPKAAGCGCGGAVRQ